MKNRYLADNLETGLGRELRQWIALGVTALAVAGIFALLIAISRIPGIDKAGLVPLDFFDKGLVIHVVFSFVAWFLAVFGAFCLLALHGLKDSLEQKYPDGRPRLAFLGRLGVICVALSFPALFIPAFFDLSQASLNNYVPVIISPIYYAGLCLLFAGAAFSCIRLVVNLLAVPRPWPVFSKAMGVTCLVYLIALGALIFSCVAQWDLPFSTAYNEDLFWGGGHTLQFVNLLMMLCAWYLLSGEDAVAGLVGGEVSKGAGREIRLIDGRILLVICLLLLIFALIVPAFYLRFEAFSLEQTLAFSELQFVFGPAALMIIVGIVAALFSLKARGARLPWGHPAFLAITLSALLFVVGGFFGIFVDGTDTRTPAHYHGVIAGINLSFMGVILVVILPLIKRAVAFTRVIRGQLWCFGGGQLFACVGLFLAGGHGAPRKVSAASQSLSELGAVIGLYMNGIGALVAVIGGILFIVTVGRALLRHQSDCDDGAVA